MSRCQCCRVNESEWAWQPFGPDDKITSFSVPGYHYRGFPALKICNDCKVDVENGHPGVVFTYKHVGYYAYNHIVKETPF